MLKIRLPNGNIRELNDSQELASAIRAGEVGPDAEIFHAKSARWVSVTDHPIFRRMAAAPSPPPSDPEPPPVAPTPAEPSATSGTNQPSDTAAVPTIQRVESAGPSVTPQVGTGRELEASPSVAAQSPPAEHPEPAPLPEQAETKAQSAGPAAPGPAAVAAAGEPSLGEKAPGSVTAAGAGSPEPPAARAPESPPAPPPRSPQPAPAPPPTVAPGPGPIPPTTEGESRRSVTPPPPSRQPPILEMQTRSGVELAARRRSPWILPALVVVVALGMVFGGFAYLRANQGEAAGVPVPKPASPKTPSARTIAPVPRDTSPTGPPSAAVAKEGVPPRSLADRHARLAVGLDSGLSDLAGRLGLNGLLAIERLGSGDSIRASRGALRRFGDGLVTYRSKLQALSKVYNDSADAFVLSGAWDRGALQEWQVRVRRPEPPAVVARADALLANLDSLLALFVEHEGAYQISPTAIRFQAPRATLRYENLVRAVNASRVNPTENVSAPLTVLSRAIAGTRLPAAAVE